MTPVGVVLVTAPTEEVATRLARTLLEEGLIACANVVPMVRSLYRWKGKLCDESEVLMVMKTRRASFEALQARVKALHPYETPEVLLLGVEAGHAPYLEWVLGSVPAAKRATSSVQPSKARAKRRR